MRYSATPCICWVVTINSSYWPHYKSDRRFNCRVKIRWPSFPLNSRALEATTLLLRFSWLADVSVSQTYYNIEIYKYSIGFYQLASRMRSTNTELRSLKTLSRGTAVLIGKTPESSPFVLLIDRSSISATNRPSRRTLIDTVGFSIRKDNSMFWYGFRTILHAQNFRHYNVTVGTLPMSHFGA